MVTLTVRLCQGEVEVAAFAARLRHEANRGRRDSYGFTGDGLAIEVRGCQAEMAVAKALGWYWTPVVANPWLLHGDIDNGWQVRSTRMTPPALILHPRDPDEALFVLVTGEAPLFSLVGCLRARDGKRRKWWRDPTGRGRWAFFVPADALHPVPVGRQVPLPLLEGRAS